MTIGIIAEGWSDVGVIQNILKAVFGVDRSDLRYLLPGEQEDDTAIAARKHKMEAGEFSNWTLVMQACQLKEFHLDFFDDFIDDGFMVVHLDTDVRKEAGYDIHEPKEVDDEPSHDLLVKNVSDKLDDYLGAEYSAKTAYAISVQEIEAWVMTIYSDKKETGNLVNGKEKLEKAINQTKLLKEKDKKRIFAVKTAREKAALSSNEFRKEKNLSKYAKQNRSLALFLQALERFKEEA